ncbi:MAG TPA: hypothetical protein VNC84_06380 [Gammaproteobacteria bacterium]|nr:hypothetical protein [Gammaproteobacteria bacterium]
MFSKTIMRAIAGTRSIGFGMYIPKGNQPTPPTSTGEKIGAAVGTAMVFATIASNFNQPTTSTESDKKSHNPIVYQCR